MAQDSRLTNEDRLRQIAAMSDVYMQGQLTAAVAADQRALVFAGFLAAAVAALGGTAASVLTGSQVDHYLGSLALWAAGGLLLAMIVAVLAARPTKWFFPGTEPGDWGPDYEINRPESDTLRELLADYDERIKANHRIMQTGGRLIMASAGLAFFSLAISGGVLVCHLSNSATVAQIASN